MRYLAYLIIVGAYGLSSHAETAEQWLGAPEYRTVIGARAGFDADRNIVGLDAQLTLPLYSLLTVQWLNSERSTSAVDTDEDFDNYFIQLSSDPLATWSVAVEYDYYGDEQIVEVEDFNWSIQYYPGNWLVSIAYLHGEISSFIRPEVRNRPALDNTFKTIDREGFSVGMDYYLGAFSYHVDAQRINYSVDLSQVQTSRRLQRILSQQTLSQIFSLVDWQINGNVTYDWPKASASVGMNYLRLAVDSDKISNLYSSVDYQLSESINIALMLAQSLDDSLLYSEFSASYQW